MKISMENLHVDIGAQRVKPRVKGSWSGLLSLTSLHGWLLYI